MRILALLVLAVLALAGLAPAFSQAFLPRLGEGDEAGPPEPPTGSNPDARHGETIATKGLACDGQTECFPCFQCHGEEGRAIPARTSRD